MNEPLIDVKNLCIDFRQGNRLLRAVDRCSFSIRRGEMLALVGESGSGKSVTALSLLGLLPKPAGVISEGSVLFDGRNLIGLPEEELNTIRGNRIAMIFQEPMTALNPVLTIGWQIAEVLRQHTDLSPEACTARTVALLEQVGIPAPEKRIREYPHQLSGGMRQRVMIAMALACTPDLIIADEPTTALDVTVQAQIMALLDDLRRKTGTAVLLITHNLALVRQCAYRVAVMYAGQIVETADCTALFRNPRHPYTRLLLQAVPSASARGIPLCAIAGQVPAPGEILPGCRFAPRCPYADDSCTHSRPAAQTAGLHSILCHKDALPDTAASARQQAAEAPLEKKKPLLQITGLCVRFPVGKTFFGRPAGMVRAVDGVTLTVNEGETLAIVGESGCGKTTLGKAIIRLVTPTSGSIRIGDSPDLAALTPRQLAPFRQQMAMVFQDPFSSLDPRMMLGDTIAEGLSVRGTLSKADIRQRVEEITAQVGLPADALRRYPHQFSGGQRQRASIARALAVQPKLLICDECTSALDVSVQAQILNLLTLLKRSLGLSYLFITHDLSVVSYIADRIAIMYLGEIVEEGSAREILEHPAHPYTQCLLASAPRLDGTTDKAPPLPGELPSPLNPPDGCRFNPRCPYATPQCRAESPAWMQLSETHRCRCIHSRC